VPTPPQEMSKSKGKRRHANAFPRAVRLRRGAVLGGAGHPGRHTFDEGQMKIGRRLAIKILNARSSPSRGRRRRTRHRQTRPDAVTEPLDRHCSPFATSSRTHRRIRVLRLRPTLDKRAFLLGFCDDYVSSPKQRAYARWASAGASARAAFCSPSTRCCASSRRTPVRDREVWSWWHDARFTSGMADENALGRAAADGVPPSSKSPPRARAVRKKKTEQQRSFAGAKGRGARRPARLALLRAALDDVRELPRPGGRPGRRPTALDRGRAGRADPS